MLGVLDTMQIDNLLLSQVVGRIGCCNRGKPYIVPVTYTFDGKCIYGQSREGLKLNILRRHPRVCFEVESMTDMANWKSAIVWGEFEELKGKEAEAARKKLFDRVLSLATSSYVHPHEHGTNGEIEHTNRVKPVMYRINIREKSGRFESI